MVKLYRFFIPILVIVTALNTLRAGGLAGHQLANKTPKKFIPNKGQLQTTKGGAARQVRYYFQGQKASVYFREKGWSYVFSRQKGGNEPTSSENLVNELTKLPSANQPDQREYYRLDVDVVGANPDAAIKGLQKTKPYYNYYLGHCPDGIEKVYSRKKLVYEDIYPGTDLVFYFSNGKLKYDFKVKNGQNADQIKLRYQGADDLKARLTNQLVVTTPMGSFKETIPAVYQETASGRQFYEGGYRVEGNTVTFQTKQAIRGNGDLVIDPRLDWSTYFGDTDFDEINSIGVSDSQDVYVCGYTQSSGFPTTNGVFQTSLKGTTDAFTAKFDSGGSLIWSTFYGGSGGSRFGFPEFNDLALDDSSNVYLTGYTSDSAFPVTNNAFQDTIGTPSNSTVEDATIVKLSNKGLQVYSSFYGGSDEEFGNAIAVDNNKNVYVGGQTNTDTADSPPFPLLNPFDSIAGPSRFGTSEGFLVKFDSSWNRKWSTYYGGSGGNNNEEIKSLGIDPNGQVIIGGETNSDDTTSTIATANSFQDSLKGGIDFFVAKLTAGGNRVWGSYVGGSGFDNFKDLTINSNGDIFLVGNTYSSNFPLSNNAYQSSIKGNSDAVILKLDSSGNSKVYSSLFGGGGAERFFGVSIGKDSLIYLTGESSSSNYPTTYDLYNDYPGAPGGFNQFVPTVTVFNDTGGLYWSSFLGGTNDGTGKAIALDEYNNIYSTGNTEATNFPTTQNAYQNSISGQEDGFITKINCILKPELTVVGDTTFCKGDSVTLKATPGFSSYDWTNTSKSDSVITVKTAGTYSVSVTDADSCYGETRSVNIDVINPPLPQITYSGNTTLCGNNDSLKLSVFNTYPSYDWSTGDTTRSIVAKSSGNYSVTITDTNGCQSTSNPVNINQVPAPNANIQVNGSTTLCQGDSVTLDAGSGYSAYSWSTGATTRKITVSKADTFDVVVFNGFGCTDTSNSVITTVKSLPSPNLTNLGQDTLCLDDTTRLTVKDSFSSYQWNTGDTTDTVAITKPGAYYTTVTDSSGCRGNSDTLNIQSAPRPSITPSSDQTICPGDSVTFTAQSGFDSYQWSNTDTSLSTTVKTSGDYYVTATDTSGCSTRSDTVNVQQKNAPSPTITANGPTQFCSGNSVTLKSTNAYQSYNWTNGDTTRSTVISSSGSYKVTVTDTNGCQGTSNSQSVTVNPTPIASISTNGSTDLCKGDSVTLDAGTGYASYNWSNNKTTQKITVSSADTFDVVVANGFGCKDTSAPVITTVNSIPAPQVKNLGNDTLCFKDTARLTVTGTYSSYKWSKGGKGDTITVTKAGRYFTTVTDSIGCKGNSDTVAIQIEDSTSITPSNPQAICPGDSIRLSAPQGFNTYQWSNGDTTRSIQATSSGNYYVTVTDSAGCARRSDTVNIPQKNPPSPTIIAQGSTQFCAGGSVTLKTANTYNSYSWSNGDTTRSTVVRKSGNYTVTVTDKNGCSGSSFGQSVTVFPKPNVSITANRSTDLCQGDTVTLSAGSGFTAYTWSSGQSTSSIKVAKAGTYSVTVFNGLGCSGTSGNVKIDVFPNPKPSIRPVAKKEACQGDTLRLQTDSTYQAYQWSSGDTVRTAELTQSGSYEVTVTDTNGCKGTSGRKSLTFFSNPVPQVKTVGDTSFCQGDSIQVYADSSYVDYQWSTGDTTQFIYEDTAKAIDVTVTDTNGCTGTSPKQDLTFYSLPTPTVTASGPTDFCKGDSITLTGASGFSSYQWESDSSGTFDTLKMDSSLTVKSSGNYRLGVVDSNQCFGYSDTIDIFVSDPDPLVQYSRTEVLCNDQDSLKLQADTNFATYQWSNGDTTSFIYVDSNGTFDVTVTDTLGCKDSSQKVSITRESNPKPAIIYAGSDTACASTGVKLTVDSAYDQYQWDNGDTTKTATIFSSGNYGVTVTDTNGCKGKSGKLTATVLDTPQPTINVIDTTVFCADDSSRLETDSTYNAYAWSNGDTTRQVTVFKSDSFTVTVTDTNGCSGVSAKQGIKVNPLPQPSITVSKDTICPSDSSLLSTPISYEEYKWSTSDTGNSIYAKQQGDYNVTVTDSNNCRKASDSVSIKEFGKPAPSITTSNGDTICDGDSTTLSLQQSYTSYDWGSGATGPDTTVFEQGNYEVTVTDSNGCFGKAGPVSITVNDTPQPTINVIDSTVFCADDSSRLETDTTYDAYAWSNGDTTRQVTVFKSDSFTVTVTDTNGCSGVSGKQGIKVNPLPQPSITVSKDTICPSDSSLLSTPISYEEYKWSTSDTAANIYAKQQGDYNVTVTDSNNCRQASDSVSIKEFGKPAPSITTSNGDTICDGDSTTLSLQQSYTSYDWGSGATDPDTTVFEQDSYEVTVTDSNGCFGKAGPVSITVNDTPRPAIEVIDTAVFCNTDSSRLRVDSAYADYAWQRGDTTRQITVFKQGTYTVTATNTKGCSGESPSQSITVKSLPQPTIQIRGNDSICRGDSVQLATSQNYPVYQWSSGDTTSAIYAKQAQDYGLTVTASNGCRNAADSVFVEVIERPQPAISASGPTTFCVGDSVTLEVNRPFAGYQWSNGKTTKAITVKQTGDFEAVVRNTFGCRDTSNRLSTLTKQRTDLPIASSLGRAFCKEDTTTLSVDTFAYQSYTWSTGDTTSAIAVAKAGSYAVERIDTNNCLTRDTIPVTVYPKPDPRPSVKPVQGDKNFCFGDSLALQLSTNFPGNSWSTGDTSRSIFVDTTQAVFNQVTDTNNCRWLSDTLRVVASNPEVSVNVLDTNEFCQGNSTGLQASRNFAAYDWSTGDTTKRITVKQTGAFSLTGIDSIGCSTSSDTVGVQVNPLPQPRLSLASDTLVCKEDTINVAVRNAPFDTYQWNTGDTTASVFVSRLTPVTATVTDANGCTNTTDTNQVNFKPLPDPVIDSSDLLAFCEGDSVILEANQSFDGYQWSTGANSRGITIRKSGNYSLRVSDSIGCLGFTDTAEVVVDPISKPDLSPDSTILCGDETVTFDPGDAYETYAWSNGSEQSQIEVDSTGSYFVEVSVNRNCERASDTVKTIAPDPLKTPTIIEMDDSLTVDVKAAGYDWSRDNQPLTKADDQTILIEQSGTYEVTIIDSFGCSKRSEPYQVDKIKFSVYPNPVTDWINFELETPEPENITVQLINSAGKVLQTREIGNYEGIYRGRINVQQISQGLYILRVITDSQDKAFKLEKVGN